MFKNLELTWKKVGLILILLCSIFLLFTSIDLSSRELIDNSFDQALIVFGSAKALNAVISLAQGTELGGIGATIAIGEVLDPINDLVEQFSWVMLAALTSLGLQKIVMNFITSDFFNIIFVLSVLSGVFFTIYTTQASKNIGKITLGVATVIIFLRFAIPFMSIINISVYENFVKPEYDVTVLQKSIITVEKSIDTAREESSIFDANKTIDKYKNLAQEASNNIISLVIAFVFQTMLFPILFLLALYGILKRVFFILK